MFPCKKANDRVSAANLKQRNFEAYKFIDSSYLSCQIQQYGLEKNASPDAIRSYYYFLLNQFKL